MNYDHGKRMMHILKSCGNFQEDKRSLEMKLKKTEEDLSRQLACAQQVCVSPGPVLYWSCTGPVLVLYGVHTLWDTDHNHVFYRPTASHFDLNAVLLNLRPLMNNNNNNNNNIVFK